MCTVTSGIKLEFQLNKSLLKYFLIIGNKQFLSNSEVKNITIEIRKYLN